MSRVMTVHFADGHTEEWPEMPIIKKWVAPKHGFALGSQPQLEEPCGKVEEYEIVRTSDGKNVAVMV